MSVTAVTSSRPASEAAAVMFPRSFRRSSRARDRAGTLQGSKGQGNKEHEVTSAAGGAAHVQASPVASAPAPASLSSLGEQMQGVISGAQRSDTVTKDPLHCTHPSAPAPPSAAASPLTWCTGTG